MRIEIHNGDAAWPLVAGCDFALRFTEAHNAPLYASLGWRAYEGDILVEQPDGKRTFFMAPMIFDLKRTADSGTIDLCGLPW